MKINFLIRQNRNLLGVLFTLTLLMPNVGQASASERSDWHNRMMPITPRRYLAHYTSTPIRMDGKLDDAAWQATSWTADFGDIQGQGQPQPRYRTRAKLLWDEMYLYIAAELSEPNVWATLTQHDSVIFRDPDFEVFIDPDGDTHNYYEFEMNALNTSWDLLLDKPYQDLGKAHNEWDIPGLRTGVQVQGSINNPSDTDHSWTVEIAFPWKVLSEHARHSGPPTEGEQWRIDFSRVEWQITKADGRYEKVPNRPEDNWVWSPQGVIDMHRPEMWGQLQFTRRASGSSSIAPIPGKRARDFALEVYYAQRDFRSSHERWASSLDELGMALDPSHPGIESAILEAAPDGYFCTVTYRSAQVQHHWRIRQDRLLKFE